MNAADTSQVPPGVPVERVDALYGLPLEDFTPSRDRLATELRKAGQREQATWVKALRRPSTAAWLVNQLARTQGREANRLVEAGKKVRDAQERALAGDASPGELARANQVESEAVQALLAVARGFLDRRGRSPSQATMERVEQTLRAVAVDERARAEFVAGRLTRELRASGLGLEGLEGALMPGSARSAETTREPRRQPRRAEKSALRDALREAKAEQRARRRVVTDLERAVQRARREAERAQRQLDEAIGALEQARAAENAAQKSVAEAAAALERAS